MWRECCNDIRLKPCFNGLGIFAYAHFMVAAAPGSDASHAREHMPPLNSPEGEKSLSLRMRALIDILHLAPTGAWPCYRDGIWI